MARLNSRAATPPSDIQVFVELFDGEPDDAGKGILSEASRLARTLDCGWSVIIFAGAAEKTLEVFASYGVEQITVIEGPESLADSLESQAKIIAGAAIERKADLLLLPHNDLGGSLAPLLAAHMRAALFTEAIAYDRDGDSLMLIRQILGAQVAESKIWSGLTPLVLTINPRVLSATVLPTMQDGSLLVANWQPSEQISPGPTRIVERIPADPQTVDVAEAEVIVSAGLGCNEETFAQVKELARLLNASLGVTRPVYDLDFADFERMVGQTGKTVAPRFYLALGISGSMHHLGGIKESKYIVSVNIDPKVPMFPNSDEGFVADLREVLPLLLERIHSATGGAA